MIQNYHGIRNYKETIEVNTEWGMGTHNRQGAPAG